MRKRSAHFYRLLFSFSLSLILPLIVMSTIVFGLFVQVLRDEVVDNSGRTLMAMQESLDSKLVTLSSMTGQVAQNHRLTPYAITRSPAYMREAMDELRKYVAASDFVDIIALYVRGTEYVVGDSSSYSIQTFGSSIFRFADWSAEEMKRSMDGISLPLVRPVETVVISQNTSRDFLTYMYPVPLWDPEPYATIMYFVDVRRIGAIFGDAAGARPELTIVLSPANQLVYASDPTKLSSEQAIDDIVRSISGYSIGTVTMDGSAYHVFGLRSPRTGFGYANLVPVSVMMEKVHHIELVLLLVVVGCFILGSVAIFILTRLNYRPVEGLRRHVAGLFGGDVSSEDDFGVIEQRIDEVSNLAESMSDAVEKGRAAMKERHILRMVKGYYATDQEAHNHGTSINVEFPYEQFAVAICVVTPRVRAPIQHEMIAFTETLLADVVYGRGIERLSNDDIILILNKDPLTSDAKVHQIVTEASERIGSVFECTVTVGLGGFYAGVKSLGRSYIEADTAADYRVLKGSGTIIRFADVIARHGTSTDFPLPELEALEHALRLGQFDEIELALAGVFRSMDDGSLPLYLAKCVCAEIVATVARIMYEYGVEWSAFSTRLPNVLDLGEFNDVGELRTSIQDIVREVTAAIRRSRESQNDELHKAIDDHIAANYSRLDFSLEGMAQELGVSASYLSRFFRDHHGCTISHYISQVRIDAAKHLLRTTDLPVGSIVTAVGYWDTSSFIRKFKQLEGITPGRFRTVQARRAEVGRS